MPPSGRGDAPEGQGGVFRTRSANGRLRGYGRPIYTNVCYPHAWKEPLVRDRFAPEVYRWCDGSYFEDQDMFRFSGIFRDVSLVAEPVNAIRDFRVRTIPLDREYREWRRFFCLEPIREAPSALAPGASRTRVVRFRVRRTGVKSSLHF